MFNNNVRPCSVRFRNIAINFGPRPFAIVRVFFRRELLVSARSGIGTAISLRARPLIFSITVNWIDDWTQWYLSATACAFSRTIFYYSFLFQQSFNSRAMEFIALLISPSLYHRNHFSTSLENICLSPCTRSLSFYTLVVFTENLLNGNSTFK